MSMFLGLWSLKQEDCLQVEAEDCLQVEAYKEMKV